jgi:redox-sensitive bicupin YhaK (pirin superfamily)
MTSGAGISHAEQTPRENTGRLNGVQLWTALPDATRHMAAAFSHVPEVPGFERAGGRAQIFAGTLDGAQSSAPYFSEILGADLTLHAGAPLELPLDPRFEHGLLVLDGDCALEGDALESRMLYYLGTNRTSAAFRTRGGARVLLIGGVPFGETVLMWWNFVARTAEEIAAARADWEAHRRFGDVPAYDGPRLEAPPLVRFARANPVS